MGANESTTGTRTIIDDEFQLSQARHWDTDTTCKYVESYAKRNSHDGTMTRNQLSFCIKYLMSQQLNGTKLLKLNEYNIHELSLDSTDEKNMLLQCASHIRSAHNVSVVSSDSVKSKCHKVSQEDGIKVIVDKLQASRSVTDPLKAREIAEKLASKESLMNLFMSVREIHTFEDLLEEEMNSNENEDTLDINEMVGKASTILYDHLVQEEEFLKVKLVIVEQNNVGHKIIQKISPVLNQLNIAPTFGSYHTAVIVGSWYFDWNTSGVIIPRKCYSRGSVLALDLEKSLDYEVTDDMINVRQLTVSETFERVAECIVFWNCNQEYGVKTNCHHFVRELCDRLNVRLEFTGLLDSYMRKLKKYGHIEMRIDLTDHPLRSITGTTEILFNTHRELDQFVHSHHTHLSSDDVRFLIHFYG